MTLYIIYYLSGIQEANTAKQIISYNNIDYVFNPKIMIFFYVSLSLQFRVGSWGGCYLYYNHFLFLTLG